MLRSSSNHCLAVAATRSLVLLALWGALPATAAASCGDWLGGHHGALERPDVAAGELPGPDRVNRSMPGRCNGPRCEGRQHDIPATPPAPVVSSPLEHLAWLTETVVPIVETSGQLYRDVEGAREAFVPFLPDRPPKV